MPADNRSVVVTLKLDSNASEETSPVDTSSAKQSTDKNGSMKALAAFAVAQMAQLAASELVSWGEYYQNKELTLSDDYIGQRNKTIALTQMNRAISSISTIGSMTAAGATFGPWGAAIGAAIGVATVVAGIARSNIQGQEQQDIALRQMDAQLGFTRSRAGWSLNAGSIGEDL